MSEKTKPTRILKLPAVEDRTSFKRAYIYEMVAEKRFPAPIKLGKRSVGWIESEVDEWLDSRIAASRQKTA